MVYLFLADGFEECEALVPLDILRRADIEVKTVGVEKLTVTGAHGISVNCDISEDDCVFENLKAVILPGGMPGTINLEKSETVQKFVDFANSNNLCLAAICAAPSILGHKGILKGKKATCFTGFENDLSGAVVTNEPVVKDGNIITAFGAGAAFPFGFTILAALKDKTDAEQMQKQMRYIK